MSATERIDSGIALPLIAGIHPVDAENRIVKVTWAGGERAGKADVVDLSPLIDTHRFYRPLRNDPALFDTVHVVDNGEAVGWGDDSIDMSADSIDRLAAETMAAEDFRAFPVRNKLTPGPGGCYPRPQPPSHRFLCQRRRHSPHCCARMSRLRSRSRWPTRFFTDF